MEHNQELPIFVYGTLMVGERNYIKALHENLECYEEASMKGELYYYHKEDYPALVEGVHWVKGQLFSVKNLACVLPLLDQIEGYYAPNHTQNLYDRKVVVVQIVSNGERKMAYAYMINPRLIEANPEAFSLIKSHCWKTFNSMKK